jgi:hypothetical protein
MLNKFLYMLHVLWLDVKYTLSVVQNILVYIKCISTSQKVIKLQLNLQLNEHKALIWMKNPISQYRKMYNLIVAP